jgi:carbon storage regulator
MLVISRRKGQRITIGDEIELVVTELHRSSVKVGIRAPRGYAVMRGEVRDSIETANRAASETTLEDSDTLSEHLALSGSTGTTSHVDLLARRQSTGEHERQNRDVSVVTEVILRGRATRQSTDAESAEDPDTAEVR